MDFHNYSTTQMYTTNLLITLNLAMKNWVNHFVCFKIKTIT